MARRNSEALQNAAQNRTRHTMNRAAQQRERAEVAAVIGEAVRIAKNAR